MNDIHEENCMVDKKGNFWIIDVGYFKSPDGFNFSRDEAFNLLSWANIELKHLPVSMTPVAL